MGSRPALAAGGAALSGYTARDLARIASEDLTRKRHDRNDFSRDRARVVHSASLRRLSTKTQVWQAGTDDFVRNRLTHSLEVAQIGRELAVNLGANADVVDAACLAHDLGHPPFGHFGETVLNEIAGDIGGFEGNAQTFRLLTRLEAKAFTAAGCSAGLNLTRATLDAVTKYPWRRGDVPNTHKFGVYADDAPTFNFMREGATAHRRCFEAQIMDWSDDVAYSVHDLEDGIAAGAIDPVALHDADHQRAIVTVAQQRYARDLAVDVLTNAWCQLAQHDLPRSYDGSRRSLAWLKNMTSTLVGRFALGAEQATREQFGAGPLTRYAADLVVPEGIRAEVAVLKAAAAHFIMMTDLRAELLMRQEEIIHTVVEHYLRAPEALDAEFQADLRAAEDEGAALRVIVDQVASLTDQRAALIAQQSGR